MKFRPESADGVNVVTRHDDGRVWVNATPHDRSVLVPWVGTVVDWDCAGAAALTAAHFERVAALAPEVVIYGSGRALRFAAPALQRALIDRGIGVETMDTRAACRTYNVLAAEGRRVVAALVVEPG